MSQSNIKLPLLGPALSTDVDSMAKKILAEHQQERRTERALTMARRRILSNFYSVIGICLIIFFLLNFAFWILGALFRGPRLIRNLPAELQTDEQIYIYSTMNSTGERNNNCTYHNETCVEVYHCGYDDKLTASIYVYPIQQYFDDYGQDITPPMSREFEEMLRIIAESEYYTNNPETACFFLPSLDLLNQNYFNASHVGQILANLPWWREGRNHILINFLPGTYPEYQPLLDMGTEKAMVFSGGLSNIYYRRTFDMALPVYNPFLEGLELPPKEYSEDRRWLLISAQFGLNPVYKSEIEKMALKDSRVLILDKCGTEFNYSSRCDRAGNEYGYPQILQEGSFCLVARGIRLGQPSLLDALMADCIPLVVADGYLMPFHEVLDWPRASVHITEAQLPEALDILKDYSMDRIQNMRRQIQFYWQKYFKSLQDITYTALTILNDRVFPYNAKTYDFWNELPNKKAIKSPLWLPSKPPKSVGFTAVILTFDRIDSLFQVVRQVGRVPSLAKVIIVWNNQDIKPPPINEWPNIGRPLKIIQTVFNRLSNRFFPYDDIETECILALDDDIIMLTPDEIEFGYEVWRENPDRLVGYPSRLHVWQNETQSFSYESEWMNTISMVLTGAAFHHKYYAFMYTYGMPANLRQWVDEHINCEDIAMNFLVTNVTGKAPIKVVPRKKFKCPECVKEMLSAGSSHMVHRSECINWFGELYGNMPLKAIEFRADPVLYKDKMDGQLKKFVDLGTL